MNRRECVVDRECHTGESPLWHPEEQRVYWVDIPNGRLFRYDPETGDHEKCLEYQGEIGGFTIQDDGSLLLFLDRGTVRPWTRTNGLGPPIIEDIPAERHSRFNDVIADPMGRVYGGTMPTEDRGGHFYRIDVDGRAHPVLDGLAVPNGLAFGPNQERLYLAETLADRILAFDYDESMGAFTNRRVFLDADGLSGKPDGLTIDSAGNMWVAFWDGGRLIQFAQDGTERRRVPFPARKVTSLTFGGRAYQDAFVTTALGPGSGEPGCRAEEGHGAGSLFRIRPETPGVPEFRSRIRTS